MKKLILTLSSFILILGKINAQGPTLSLVGGSPSLSKGDINTQVLAQLIQQKQEEGVQKFFRNTIIKGFNNSEYIKSLKNFTTYYYLYSLMDVMVSGKNKTYITKSITESSTEFAYIFGLALYIQKKIAKEPAAGDNGALRSKSFGTLTITENFIADAKVKPQNLPDLDKVSTINISKKVKDFNIIVDLCYDVILHDTTTLKQIFKFKGSLTDKNFRTWYEADNAYTNEYKNADETHQKDLDNLRDEVTRDLSDIAKLVREGNSMITTLNNLKSSSYDSLKIQANEILSSLSDLSGEELKNKVTNIQITFSGILNPTQNAALTKIIGYIGSDYDNLRQLINFYIGLKKSDFKDFTLTKDQYYSMKYILKEFLELAKNQYEKNGVATIIDFMLENTLIEYSDLSGNQKTEEKSTNNDKGYLYVDIESLISAIDQKFSPTNRKGIGVYITPFVSVGTNYASFLKTNKLTTDANGFKGSLNNLYFASEKIGIKWKIWNWKYTHSFGAGENFHYYNKKSTYRYWLRPQPKPTVSDIHLFAYGSGILYNIANLKSDDKFSYAIIGIGLGITFFNGLTANASIACPFTGNSYYSNNIFFNLGFDIPIIEYIAGLRKK